MSVRSVYLPEPSIENDQIRIRDDENHHLIVARIQPLEPLEIFDGKGDVWNAVVVSVTKRETVARIEKTIKVQPERFEIILGLALVRMAAFEIAIEKVTELGVTRIVPFVASRSNVSAPHRSDRWERILVEAAKQSKRYYLPSLDPVRKFDDVVRIQAASKIVFAEHDGGSLKSAIAGSPALYLIGPEGGWTDRELSVAAGSGFHSVSLGASILKAETAAIVGASLIRYELGS